MYVYCIKINAKMRNTTFTIANTAAEYEWAKKLFTAYASEIEGDICFQNFQQELQKMPEYYGPPQGALVLLQHENKPVGCIGLKGVSAEEGEIKRLYLKKQVRGKGYGKALLNKIIKIAHEKNYRKLKLDTLPAMETAIRMYQHYGFKETTPQIAESDNSVRFFELNLEDHS